MSILDPALERSFREALRERPSPDTFRRIAACLMRLEGEAEAGARLAEAERALAAWPDEAREARVSAQMFTPAGEVARWVELVRELLFWLPDDSDRSGLGAEMERLMQSPYVACVVGIGVGQHANVSLGPVVRSPHLPPLVRLTVHGAGLHMTAQDWAAFRASGRFDALRALAFQDLRGDGEEAFFDLATRLADQLEALFVTQVGPRTRALVAALGSSFPRLRALSLRHCGLGDADLDGVLAARAALDRVDVANNYFGAAAMDRFRRHPRWQGRAVTVRSLLR